jgi:hypothetical protein
MERQNKDESRDRRREEALARQMGDALDRLSPRDAGECPDAELIAAYYERALQPDELAQWESHFATCVRCRKILLVLSASTGTPLDQKEVARLGQLAAASRTPLEAASRPAEPNRFSWRARWLAPALGAAAVLAVWFVMRPPWRVGDQNPSGTLVAQAPKSEPPQNTVSPALDDLSKVAPQQSAKADAVTAKEKVVTRDQSLNLAGEAPAKKALADGNAIAALPPGAGAAGGMIGNERKDEAKLKSPPAGVETFARQRLALQASPEAPPKTEAQDTGRAQSSTGVPGSAAQPEVVTEAAPAVSAAGAASNAPAGDKQKVAGQAATDNTSVAGATKNLSVAGGNFRALSRLEEAGANSALAGAPSGLTLWRAGKGGNIERSTDAGRKWVVQASPLPEDWLAGAAVSDNVCWMVGRNGAIARTTDGENWEKVTPPPSAADPTGRLPDWVGVTSSDAQAATITARDRRRYATQDGGKTWHFQ